MRRRGEDINGSNMYLRFFIAILCLLMACVTGISLVSYFREQSVLAHVAAEGKQSGKQEESVVSSTDLLAELGGVADAPLSSGQVWKELARLWREESLKADDVEKRAYYLCQAMSAIRAALAREPLNNRLIVRWADIKQILGGFSCPQGGLPDDYVAALKYAVESDPHDVFVTYSAGLVFYWADKKDDAYQYLREALLLGASFGETERRHIFSLVNNADAVSKVIPGRFPQVAQFSHYVNVEQDKLRIAPNERVSFFSRLDALQVQAISLSSAEFETRSIPLKLHESRLLSLMSVPLAFEARSALDRELARVYGRSGWIEVAKFFATRSSLVEIPVVRASIAGDTRPLKSSLANWGKHETISFDDYFRTIGFYLPRGDTPTLIELNSQGKVPEIQKLAIRVLASNDNFAWQDVSDSVEIFQFSLGDRSSIALKLKTLPQRYWKIHFESSAKNRQFVNALDLLLTVYGMR